MCPVNQKFYFPFDTYHACLLLGFFCFGEDLLYLEEGLALGLWHAEHVEQVAGQGYDGKYPEMEETRLKESSKNLNMDVPISTSMLQDSN